ncbi:MAG TPA: hypothetical protein VGN83_03930 [Falsiroseomonas sp.]|jgi:hypothetical protein|nr:hypothetical protein [Falsiroseomonas sp.]
MRALRLRLGSRGRVLLPPPLRTLSGLRPATPPGLLLATPAGLIARQRETRLALTRRLAEA